MFQFPPNHKLGAHLQPTIFNLDDLNVSLLVDLLRITCCYVQFKWIHYSAKSMIGNIYFITHDGSVCMGKNTNIWGMLMVNVSIYGMHTDPISFATFKSEKKNMGSPQARPCPKKSWIHTVTQLSQQWGLCQQKKHLKSGG